MNVSDAAYLTVHDYPGGSESLAPRMGKKIAPDATRKSGMSPAILRGKVNPKDDSHHLTLDEAMRMMALTGDVRILLAMASELGHVCIPVPDFCGIADIELLDAYTAMVQDKGVFAADFREALRDGKITRAEYEKLLGDVRTQQAHEMELLARIESMVVEE